MTKRNGCKMSCLAFLVCALAGLSAQAQSFTDLHDFAGYPTDGSNPPFMSLVQGVDGNFYGTTEYGGTNTAGTVFKITPGGTETPIYSFCPQGNCTTGYYPFAGLVLGTNGNFYGTTFNGGNGSGTVFEITPAGVLTRLYEFCSQSLCADGSEPYAPLVLATNGNFYGTTYAGGEFGYGTVFEITPAGKFTSLYSFCLQHSCTDGSNPTAGLVQATNGNLYGTTLRGGAILGSGTIFEITPAGKFTSLYSFCSQPNCTDGTQPFASLVQASDGNLYGTTNTGGANGDFGTIFRFGLNGGLTTLYAFCSQPNCADGTTPYAGLVQATDGNLYGMTFNGGGNGAGGTIFDITLEGTNFTALYSFCHQTDCVDGENPYGGLLQATNGTFYGTTYIGGYTTTCDNCGTVFSLSNGLGPFVKTVPTAGKVGAEVGILGNKLKGATVSFNGTPAQPKQESPTLILTHVPAGATTGYVTVTTPSGVLKSNVPFYVIP